MPLIDNHPPFSSMQTFPSTFQVEDFFNMDLLTAGSSSSSSGANPASLSPTAASGGSSSRSSSRSPSDSFSHLPPTPIQGVEESFGFGGLPAIEEDSLFGFNYDGLGGAADFLKSSSDPLTGLASSSFDLFGSFEPGLGGVSGASSSSVSVSAPASVSMTNDSPAYPYAIDPQLVRTPAGSSHGDAESDAENDKEQDREDDEDADEVVVAPIKVGGKGKARKGTLHSGGVVKKSAAGPSSIFGALSDSGKDKADKEDRDMLSDDWRPSPEEYQKMSSKEKRQLRNKISARNFRVRRKEYIHTLEGDIAERDHLIDAIRSELGSTKSENNALRQEVAALKKAILEGRASPMLPPPAPLSPLSPLTSFATLQSPSSSSSTANSSSSKFLKPNTQKDLPTSPRLKAIGGSGAFWGGQSGFSGLGGGITPVHTALIPETNFGAPMAAKDGLSGSNSDADRSNENINPALNHIPIPLAVAASKVFGAGHGANSNANALQQQQQAQAEQQQSLLMSQVLSQLSAGPQQGGGFDTFTDVNPFTLKTLDAYRMQLWGRVAAQAQQQRARTAQAPLSPNVHTYPSPTSSASSPGGSPTNAHAGPGLSGLASGLRPHFFTTAPPAAHAPTSSTAGRGKVPSFGALLSGKGAYPYQGLPLLPTPPTSPRIGEKLPQQRYAQREHAYREHRERDQHQQQQQHALLASLCSQTLLQKMGHAFWDAFAGSSAASSSLAPPRAWDAEKVRRVLEGKAVLRVVDLEPSPPAVASSSAADALEESMRTMSLASSSVSASTKDEKKDERKGLFARMHCGSCSSGPRISEQ